MSECIIVVMGRPGVGKTTLASRLADAHGCEHLDTDEIRSAYERPAYTPDETGSVYDALIGLAAPAIERDGAVVLDATFSAPALRQQAVDLIERRDAESQWYRVTCDEEEAKDRLARRDGADGPQLHDKIQMWPPSVEPDHVTVVDTTAEVSV